MVNFKQADKKLGKLLKRIMDKSDWHYDEFIDKFDVHAVFVGSDEGPFGWFESGISFGRQHRGEILVIEIAYDEKYYIGGHTEAEISRWLVETYAELQAEEQ